MSTPTAQDRKLAKAWMSERFGSDLDTGPGYPTTDDYESLAAAFAACREAQHRATLAAAMEVASEFGGEFARAAVHAITLEETER
jgi:hypothetical protein